MEEFKLERTFREFVIKKFPDYQHILTKNARNEGNIIFNLRFYRFQTKGFMDVVLSKVNEDPKTFFDALQGMQVFSKFDPTFIKNLQTSLQIYEKKLNKVLQDHEQKKKLIGDKIKETTDPQVLQILLAEEVFF